MTGKLCVLCCGNFRTEVGAGITAEGWSDVITAAFPVRCGRPPIGWDELRTALPDDCTQVIILGRACLTGLQTPPAGFPPTRIVPVQQCFHIVAGETLVNELIATGAYLITPTWLAHWRDEIRAMGFAPETIGDFFHDFAKEIVLLDSGLDPQSPQQLAELQTAVRIPARRIAVGLDYTRAKLSRWVLEWRWAHTEQAAKEQVRRHAGELADHVAAMDMLVQLAKTQHEAEAIEAIENLFRMLFAPAALHYLRVENGVPIPRAPLPDEMRVALDVLTGEHAWTPDGQGFLLRIGHGEETLGLIAVDRLAFAQYRERYLNMALAVTGVCGLAIENARNRKRLLEAEKMASLGILVAGVAHEINTPLGVSLAAASTLQEHSRHLAEHFAAHSMTQSELTQYLETASTGTDLLRQNLERIGGLIDAFRQVAVHGNTPRATKLRLKDCLDDVIRSLGDRLPADRVAIRIDCDPTLEIDSVVGDWASIFINLIGNSLKHGFRNAAHGAIDIAISRHARALKVDYRDDGAGMDATALARIFDPFFTTDLQQGMGLGMHLVYNLITHRMGGSILCDSRPGQGVRFIIEIPL